MSKWIPRVHKDSKGRYSKKNKQNKRALNVIMRREGKKRSRGRPEEKSVY